MDRRVNYNYIDISGYQLTGWFVTDLVLKAREEGKVIYQISKEGFLDIDREEFVKKVSSSLELSFSGNKEDYCYTAGQESVLTVDAEYDSDSKSNVYLFTTDKEIYDRFETLAEEHIKNTKANTIFVLAAGSDGFYLSSVGKVEMPLVRDNYSEEVIKQFDYVVEDFQSVDPHGRLVIINGEPGTGKTYWVKGLISELNNVTAILIPPSMITQIDGPSLLPTFIDHRRRKDSSIVLILEDADSCLAPRAADNMSAISSLLNCADGILGSMLDIRIIATTNQKTEDFDPALTRPGRLTDKVKIDALSAEDATKVYRRLTGDEEFEYEEPRTLADVYIEADLNTGGKVKGNEKRKEGKTVTFTRRRRIGF